MFSFTQIKYGYPLAPICIPVVFPPNDVHPNYSSDVREDSRCSVPLRSGCFKLRCLGKRCFASSGGLKWIHFLPLPGPGQMSIWPWSSWASPVLGLAHPWDREITGKKRLLWLTSQLVQLHRTALARNYFGWDFWDLPCCNFDPKRKDTLESQH